MKTYSVYINHKWVGQVQAKNIELAKDVAIAQYQPSLSSTVEVFPVEF